MENMLSPGEQHYRMEAIPRGVCLIINNNTFKKDRTRTGAKELGQRTGSDVDRDNLKATFEDLLFEVRCHDNLTDKKMLKTVQKMAEEDHSSYDCFICVILSYGEHNNAVFGTNGMPLKIRSLTSAFKKRHCPSLDGKPKLFFVEACQASYTDQGEEDQEHVVEVISGAGVARNTRVGRSSADTDDSQNKETKLLPNETDFLLGLCVQHGSEAAKTAETGSLYIEKLTKLLKKYGSTRDIVDILTVVNEAMRKKDTAGEPEAQSTTQDPLVTKHSLRMKLRLAPSPKLKEVRLMVVGRSKRGKSSTANTILGEERFSVSNAFSQNIYSDWHQVTRDGRTIEITEMPTELESDEAARPLITITPGPHAIILCFRCEQFFSPEDYFSYSTLKKWLGSHFSKYIILVFSGLENVSGVRETEAILRTSFISIIRELPSPDRLICLDNSADWDSRRRQGDRLLRLVDRVVQDNGGGHFSNRKIRSFEEEMQYQLCHGKTREEVKKRVVAGDDIELIFEKRCCLVM